MKICTKCKVDKDEIEFHKCSKGGLQARCKQCESEYHRQRYIKNKEKIDVAHRIYQKNNKDKVNAWNAIYRAKHPYKGKLSNEERLIRKDEAKKKNRERAKINYSNKHQSKKDEKNLRFKQTLGYFKHMMIKGTSIKVSDISNEMAEAYKFKFLIKKTLKEMKNEKHE